MTEPEPRIPLATYRLQFNRHFTLRDATALVPYLDALGISDIYASPFLAARPGSLHGYDVVDHAAPQPGDRHATRTSTRCRRRCAPRGMGLLLDVVPNHMCIASVGESLLERRARERAQLARRPASSTSTGSRPRPSSPTRSCCRCWASSTAACSRTSRSPSRYDGGAFIAATSTRALPAGSAHGAADPGAHRRRPAAPRARRRAGSPGAGEHPDRGQAPAVPLRDSARSRSASGTARRRSSSGASPRWSMSSPVVARGARAQRWRR